jgi:DNA-binding transcriptional LysR family regulator
MSDRVIEMSSYHAMLGCAVAGMGISLVPRIVLRTFPDVKLLSVHTLPVSLKHAPTVFIRRKGPSSPKVNALLEVLREQPEVIGEPARSANGRDRQAPRAARKAVPIRGAA